jgi:hypothetical protein
VRAGGHGLEERLDLRGVGFDEDWHQSLTPRRGRRPQRRPRA